MREALRAAFDWASRRWDLHRIEAQIHPDNAPSLALAEGLGFVREGRLREVGFWGGQRHDLWQLGLLRGDGPRQGWRPWRIRRLPGPVFRALPRARAPNTGGIPRTPP
jgi:hypothetical protein